MKKASEYIETVVGTASFARTVELKDAMSIMSIMDDFAHSESSKNSALTEESRNAITKAIKLLSYHSDQDFVSRNDARDAAQALDKIDLRLRAIPEPGSDIAITHQITNDILLEVSRAESKHPNWPLDNVYGMAIIGEEYGEATREAVKIEMNESDADLENLKMELIQTAATCIRMLKNLSMPIFENKEN